MKKLLLIIATIWGPATLLHARVINYGPKIGVGFSFIGNLDKLAPQKSSTEADVFDIARIAVHWGAYGEYALDQRFSVGAELMGTYVGSLYKNMGLHLSYISMPIWCMYYPCGLHQGFSVYLGPSFNFLWRAEPKLPFNLIQEDHVNPFEWAIVIGLRHLLDFNLHVDLRYNWGLTDIFDFDPHPAKLRPKQLKNVKLTNHYLQLSLGYNLAPLISPDSIARR